MDLPSLNLSNPFLDPLLHSSVIAAHTDAAWQPNVRPCAYGRAQENLCLLKENTNVRKPGPSEPSFPLTPLSRPWFLSSSAHHGSHVLSLLPSPSSISLQWQMLQEAWPARCSLLRSTLLATSCSPWAVVSTSKAGFKMVPTLYVTQAEVGWEWCRWALQKEARPSLIRLLWQGASRGPNFFSTALMCSNPLIALGARQKSPFKISPFGVATTSLTTYLCLVLAEAVALFSGLGLHLVPGCSWSKDSRLPVPVKTYPKPDGPAQQQQDLAAGICVSVKPSCC